MAVYQLKTFKDLVDAVCEELKIQSSDTTTRNRIKRDINIVYQHEVAPAEEWKWLRGFANLTRQPKITTGTATVLANSQNVTLTTAPTNSVEGYWFANDGFNERYLILSHTAGSTTLTLDSVYNGPTASAQNYTIWTDKIPLPSDCRETTRVTHDFSGQALDNYGLQKFREISTVQPKAEGYPVAYSTSDYVEPVPFAAVSGLPALSTRASSGLLRTLTFVSDVSSYLRPGDRISIENCTVGQYNGDFVVASVSSGAVQYTAPTSYTEAAVADALLTLKKASGGNTSAAYRQLMIWPAIDTTRLTLHVDYTKDVAPLENDTDEPLIPFQDRVVLLYGALSRAWVKERDEDTSNRNEQLFQRKLAKMQGKLDDSTDTPFLRPDRGYLNSKRKSQRYRSGYGSAGWGSSSGGTNAIENITGLASSVAIYDGTGVLSSSQTVNTTELGRLDGILSTAVGISDTQVLTNKTIDADLNTITNIENADIKAGANIALSKLAALTATKVVVSDSNGLITTSTVTPTELTYLTGVVPSTTVALADNQAAAATVFSIAATNNWVAVDYGISRGAGNRETGQLLIATDASTVNMTQVTSQLGTPGVTLTADISAGNVRVRYTSTSTGTAPTFKYSLRVL